MEAENVNYLIGKLVQVAEKFDKPDIAIETLDFISENIDYLNNKTYYRTTYAGADKILDFYMKKVTKSISILYLINIQILEMRLIDSKSKSKFGNLKK